MTPGPEQIDVPVVAERVLAELTRLRDARRTGEGPRKLAAIDVARQFGIRPSGSVDSRKRGTRLVMKHIREQLQRGDLCSDGEGYWLAVELTDYADSERHKRRSGLQMIDLERQQKQSPERAIAGGQHVIRPAD